MANDGGTDRHQRLYDDLRLKLLDLSRRSPMLNYQHRAGSDRQLRIVDADLEAVFSALVDDHKELVIHPLPAPDSIPEDECTAEFNHALDYARSSDFEYLTRLKGLEGVARHDEASLADLDRWLRDRVREQLGLSSCPDRESLNIVGHARKHGINPNYELTRSVIESLIQTNRIQCLYFADELDTRLACIASDARLTEQESGLSTLFLAFGFLRWFDSETSSEANFAPLLLLPVELKRRMQGRRATYYLKATAEAPEINLSLREWLQRDLKRTLPEFDEENDSIETYFKQTIDCIEGLHKWRIERNLTLGHFEFGRIAMYEDLLPANWQNDPVSHSLLRELFDGSRVEEVESPFVPSDYNFDDEEIENIAPILIHDADASQHSAIVDVMKGKNLVIEGPPGTGKSQTITNIIANALYAGKTVLFLAEKLAALQVVKDRLDRAQLGEFCLEFHSDKVHPKSIIESLKQRHNLVQERGEAPNWQIELERLRSTRGRVREYLSALHEPVETDDHTPFQLFWAAMGLRRNLSREFDAVRSADLAEFLQSPRMDIERWSQALKLYGVAANQFAERHGPFEMSPFTNAGFDVNLDGDPMVVSGLLKDSHGNAQSLLRYLAEASRDLGIVLPKDSSALEGWIKLANCAPKIPRDSLLPRFSGFKSTEMAKAAELVNTRLALTSPLEVDLPDFNPEAVLEVAQLAKDLKLAEGSPLQIVTLASTMSDEKNALLEGLNLFSAVAHALKPGIDPKVRVIEAIANAARLAAAFPPSFDQFLSFEGENLTLLTDGYKRLVSIGETEQLLRTKLNLGTDDDWPTIQELQFAAGVLSRNGSQKLIAVATGKRRQANAILNKVGLRPETEEAAALIESIILHLKRKQQFCADAQLAASASPYWEALKTPLKELAAVSACRDEFDRKMIGLGELRGPIKSNLFSRNRKFVAALRSYNEAAEQFIASIANWPYSIANMSVSQASSAIEAQCSYFIQLSEKVAHHGLSTIPITIARLVPEAERRLRLKQCEERIINNSVLAAIDERVWRTELGSLELFEAAELAKAIVESVTSRPIRDRLLGAEGCEFSEKLTAAAGTLQAMLANYQISLIRLNAAVGTQFGQQDRDVTVVAKAVEACLGKAESLPEWCEVARRRAALSDDGFGPLLTAFSSENLPVDKLSETFDALIFFHRAIRARQDQAVLRSAGLDLDADRARFVGADQALKRRQREVLRKKLIDKEIPMGTALGNPREWTDLRFLRNEFTKQARYSPTRRLLSQAGAAVTAMKPCFMMSPLSLAKFAPANAVNFDLLVIDEASQLKPEDVLGGLLRAKQVVVVGDPEQLPPTDFFSRIASADEFVDVEDDEPDDIDAESILDWALKTYSAPRRLKWHYRSKCESLIAFSNKEFYSSELITFPSPKPAAFSIDLIRVDGRYKASRNPNEASRIVEAAIDFMVRHADLPVEKVPTLGVVAINVEQREAIREQFDKSGRDDAVERYQRICSSGTALRGPEPFFVKNLENVQGDERDVIMISLTYGPEPGQTRVMQRFGPIAHDQGHRRLNVLFTRARRRVVVFSSMGSEDILVSPNSKRGVRVLRDYIRYAERRRSEIGHATNRNLNFEREVTARLEAHGFLVDPQVGVGGYRIDLGVRHPKDPAVYLAGIESDGATFHSTKSARARDRLRESVLKGLGWQILRVWSTDWWSNANLRTERLVAELNRLSERPIVADGSWIILPSGASTAKAAAGPSDNYVGSENAAGADVLNAHPLNSVDAAHASTSHAGAENGSISRREAQDALLRLRDDVIFREYVGSEPGRCILRDIMIEKILETHLDAPSDFAAKIPLWLRERTDPRQTGFLEQICAIVERIS